MPAANDREFNLQRLAAENGRWADEELRLIETIRENKRHLAELPTIIRKLRGELANATAKMNRTGAEYDALEAEGDDDCPALCDGCEAMLDRGKDCSLEAADREADRDWAEVEGAEFRAWANGQVDAVIDERATTRHPNY